MLCLLTLFVSPGNCQTPESCCCVLSQVAVAPLFHETDKQVAIAHLSVSYVWLQVVLGQALHQVDELLPSSSLPFDDIAAAVLLVFFGVRTLQVTINMTPHPDRDVPLCSIFQSVNDKVDIISLCSRRSACCTIMLYAICKMQFCQGYIVYTLQCCASVDSLCSPYGCVTSVQACYA